MKYIKAILMALATMLLLLVILFGFALIVSVVNTFLGSRVILLLPLVSMFLLLVYYYIVELE